MIEPFEGEFFRNGVRDEGHAVSVKAADGYFHGLCDICGIGVDDDDLGHLVSPYANEICDCAADNDWSVIGGHLICWKCEDKIRHGEIDIEISVVRQGVKR